MASLRLEKELARGGARRIAGVDEVGRGSLFGPVVAAAVILPAEWLVRRPPAWTGGIDDSKIVPAPRRAELAAALLREARGVGLGLASAAEIDALNIHRAAQLAMVRAVESLSEPPDILLVDGFAIKEVEYRQMGIPRGDRTSRSIAAASIVAKVFRDGLMRTFDALYEGYGLARNKGYGTEEHLRALREKGPTGLHRTSFKLG
ncbi:MAG TPA: ribonuclease HII [Candidatus Aminicenantes bacterium]|nr:ribonuclease HII [Candidatus Aminicenantes bacterium]HRY63734.1 ribonuclease HII [Candidatus Aminicenantes bacterium]HRZ70647.1 ribonuclease HII [Candidatus Aminicenantes bacterium]